MKLNVVLVEPEIPQNTGNIARTCAATGGKLHLVHPLGFSINEKAVKRAGLDYWDKVSLRVYENLDEFFKQNENGRFWFLSTKADHSYTDVEYSENDYLIFGKETHGLPEPLLKENYQKTLRIPMLPTLRSLNLSNSVAIVLYEALRQLGFVNLTDKGALTGRED